MNPAHRSSDYNHCMKMATQDCESVLELGSQFGWQLRLVDRPKMVGVEGHMPYLQSNLTVRDPRIQYIHADIRQWLPDEVKKNPKSFDCVMFIDVIEHFNKPEAIQIVKWAEELAKKKVWIWIPLGDHMSQDYDEWNMGAEHFQKHRSIWEDTDLMHLGYDVAVWPEHHRPTDAKGRPHSRAAGFAMKEFWTGGI